MFARGGRIVSQRMAQASQRSFARSFSTASEGNSSGCPIVMAKNAVAKVFALGGLGAFAAFVINPLIVPDNEFPEIEAVKPSKDVATSSKCMHDTHTFTQLHTYAYTIHLHSWIKLRSE